MSAEATSIRFVKGHGTQNDFLLIPDTDATLGEQLDEAFTRRIADRHAGLGADGVIRVVPAARVPGHEDLDDVEWFMDYRNADGSVAEMCGNGVRVMARYLWESGLADGPMLSIATRGGVRTVHAEPDGTFTVEMGHAKPASTRQMSFVAVGGNTWPATPVWVPNPHAVVFVDDVAAAGLLTEPPQVRPAAVFPESANVEFVVDRGPRHIALRVWERGVGETRSCGTGVCAAAWAAMRRDGVGAGSTYAVDVPGGQLSVTERPDGELLLTGPAVLGVRGTVDTES
ncbi:diaminopimelate epimerase [Haloactinopolyspora alba]|uniref:Diaminopimelate epimerase n=1 Tax=Haloactinopolyspora alba TaxID=648780 RepID=A0A2P8E469_9ACTN|nr:diaminopimelate epimerase [Haloactinopolyspora alba]PSL04249.1 diaminopimelate epimerase [Haloactinopolyspora alba]